MTERTATARQPGGTGARSTEDSAAAGFERLYRANVEAVTSYFARRSADPHVVADLTADTFVTAITSFASFDPGKGTTRSWGVRHSPARVRRALRGVRPAAGPS